MEEYKYEECEKNIKGPSEPLPQDVYYKNETEQERLLRIQQVEEVKNNEQY